jgi:CBS domain-containing protein
MQTQRSVKRQKTGRVAVKVAQVMTRRVTTVRAEMTLNSAMGAMISNEIGHLPVVDREGTLVGILSKTDLVRDRQLEGDTTETLTMRVPAKGGVQYPLGAGFHPDSDGERTVGDVMTKRVKTVLDSALLVDAAALMSKNRIHGLPVVNEKNRLVGFLSTFDVVDWVASS